MIVYGFDRRCQPFCNRRFTGCCLLSTLLWARIAALFANKASAVTLNFATGFVLTILGIAMIAVNY